MFSFLNGDCMVGHLKVPNKMHLTEVLGKWLNGMTVPYGPT